jgi:hypothetical protein
MNINEEIKRHDLITLQNHPANINQDHLTICAFFTNKDEFEKHAAYLRKRADA